MIIEKRWGKKWTTNCVKCCNIFKNLTTDVDENQNLMMSKNQIKYKIKQFWQRTNWVFVKLHKPSRKNQFQFPPFAYDSHRLAVASGSYSSNSHDHLTMLAQEYTHSIFMNKVCEKPIRKIASGLNNWYAVRLFSRNDFAFYQIRNARENVKVFAMHDHALHILGHCDSIAILCNLLVTEVLSVYGEFSFLPHSCPLQYVQRPWTQWVHSVYKTSFRSAKWELTFALELLIIHGLSHLIFQ